MESPWLDELLSTPLLEFATKTERPNNLDNLKHPNELDVTFLETLSDSNLQLLKVLILMNAWTLPAPAALPVHQMSRALTRHTSSASVTTENDLKLPIFWL